MNTTTELKPCPFCGSPAEIMGTKLYGYYAVCLGHGCICDLGFSQDDEIDNDFATPEESAAWNKRMEQTSTTMTPIHTAIISLTCGVVICFVWMIHPMEQRELNKRLQAIEQKLSIPTEKP